MSLELKKEVKKLVFVAATSILVIVTRKEAFETFENTQTSKSTRAGKDGEGGEYPRTNLVQVPCIRYPITFERKSVLVLLNLNNEINTIHPTFAQELGFAIRLINIRVQKIDGTTINTYRIVVAAFLLTDRVN